MGQVSGVRSDGRYQLPWIGNAVRTPRPTAIGRPPTVREPACIPLFRFGRWRYRLRTRGAEGQPGRPFVTPAGEPRQGLRLVNRAAAGGVGLFAARPHASAHPAPSRRSLRAVGQRTTSLLPSAQRTRRSAARPLTAEEAQRRHPLQAVSPASSGRALALPDDARGPPPRAPQEAGGAPFESRPPSADAGRSVHSFGKRGTRRSKTRCRPVLGPATPQGSDLQSYAERRP